MKTSVAAAIAGLALAPTPTLAADLFGTAPPPMTFPATQMEAGSNWYLRGDVGFGVEDAPTMSFSSLSIPPDALSAIAGSKQTMREFDADIGVGYRFNNYFRVDATYGYRSGPNKSNGLPQVVCPYGAYGVEDSTASPPIYYGYLYNPSNTCDPSLTLKQYNNMALANAYLDLGTFWGVTPYVGGGAGLNVQTTSGSLTFYKTSDGTVYAANLSPTGIYPQIWVDASGNPISPQPKIAFTTQNWNRSFNSTKYSMALAFMAGFGIQLSPSATLDIGYRYLNTGATTLGVSGPSGANLKNASVSQEVRIGIRYTPN